ncbi:hypothetical protein FH620_06425 [Corallococcus exiguus]|nr:hypothetical protein FH620_06425 [Corallococcus exiguus]
MLQPFRLALALVLAWGAAAHAESSPAGRVRRERPVTVAITAVWKQEMRSSSAPSPPFQNVSRKVFISRSTSSWLVSQT